MPANFAVKMFMSLATVDVAALALQVAPVSDPGLFTQAERLTLHAALLVAVAVLWRALSTKDNALMEMTKRVTEALTIAADSNKELRGVIETSVKAELDLAGELRSRNARLAQVEEDMKELHGYTHRRTHDLSNVVQRLVAVTETSQSKGGR